MTVRGDTEYNADVASLYTAQQLNLEVKSSEVTLRLAKTPEIAVVGTIYAIRNFYYKQNSGLHTKCLVIMILPLDGDRNRIRSFIVANGCGGEHHIDYLVSNFRFL